MCQISFMDNVRLNSLIQSAIKASISGGREILKVYEEDFDVEIKEDNSPLTKADRNANSEIERILEGTQLPILSEEGKSMEYEDRKAWEYFWMVDPLDGTKEFIKRNGEFTVNIALIHKEQTIAGVIFVPVKKWLYVGIPGLGSFKLLLEELVDVDLNEVLNESNRLPIDQANHVYTVVGSRSHMSPETQEFIDRVKIEKGEVEIASMGSSLKICLVAEGKADVYPRFAPTMEWDTAAGHAIAKCAGKNISDYKTGEEMRYNKENLLNNWFIVE